ncbi:MAG: hypothetical protein ACI4I2_05910 [Oscillospiraceae bacterium]
MKIKRASLCQGKGSLSHNLRLFTANNVDKTRTKDNIVFVNIPQQEMYERLFSGAVSEYNAKQKPNPEDLFCQIVKMLLRKQKRPRRLLFKIDIQ